MSHKQHLHRKSHADYHGKPLPHLADAAHPDTGEIDMQKLTEGRVAWDAAIAAGAYKLVSATEIGVDEDTDVLVLTRKRLKKA